MRVGLLAVAIGAWMVACGAAEGEPDGGVVDAFRPDAAPDPCAPGQSGVVTVDGPSATGPQAITVSVIVHDATGAVFSRSSEQGGDATFTVDVPACGLVTVDAIDPGADPAEQHTLFTWTGVQPGDHLIHLMREPVMVTYPVEYTVAPVEGATSYVHGVSCSRHGFDVGVSTEAGLRQIDVRCPANPDPVTVIVNARGPSGSSFAVAVDVPLSTSGTTIVDLSSYYAANGSMTMRVLNAGEYGDASVAAFMTLSAGRDVPFDQATGARGEVVTVGPMPVMLGVPGLVTTSLTRRAGPPWQTISVARRLTQFPGMLDLDATSHDFLPPISGALTGDASGPRVEVFAERWLDADATLITVSLVTGDGEPIRWAVLAPGLPGPVQFPDVDIEGTVSLRSIQMVDAFHVQGYGTGRTQFRELVRGVPQSSTRLTDIAY